MVKGNSKNGLTYVFTTESVLSEPGSAGIDCDPKLFVYLFDGAAEKLGYRVEHAYSETKDLKELFKLHSQHEDAADVFEEIVDEAFRLLK